MPFIDNGIWSKQAQLVSNAICRDFLICTKNYLRRFQNICQTRSQIFNLSDNRPIANLESDTNGNDKKIKLPNPVKLNSSLESVILGRSSGRDYTDQPMTLKALATLLHAAHGARKRNPWMNEPFSTMQNLSVKSSADIPYPIAVYFFVVGKVNGLKKGAYLYNADDHCLILQPVSFQVERFNQVIPILPMTENPKVLFLIVGTFAKAAQKHGPSAFRLVLNETGHVQAQLALAAEALGYGYYNFGGGYDREIEDILGLDGIEKSLLGIGVAG